jgi:hypothetical protein
MIRPIRRRLLKVEWIASNDMMPPPLWTRGILEVNRVVVHFGPMRIGSALPRLVAKEVVGSP